MNITFLDYKTDGYGVAFRTATIHSGFITNGAPLRFYSGDTSKLVSIQKLIHTEVKVHSFPFTCKEYQSLWASQYTEIIEPLIKPMSTYTSILYSLEDKRVIKKSDFVLASPYRGGDEVFFITYDDSTGTRDRISPIYFEKNSVEDLAALSATVNWYNFGIQTCEPKEQTTEGKVLMTLLWEAKYNRAFPAYLGKEKLKKSLNFVPYSNAHDHYSEKATRNLGELFEASKGNVFGYDPPKIIEGEIVPDFIEDDILPYLQKGFIQLTELVGFGVEDFIKQLDDVELDVSIDVDQNDIQEMVINKNGVHIVTKGDYTPLFFEEMLNVSAEWITVLNK